MTARWLDVAQVSVDCDHFDDITAEPLLTDSGEVVLTVHCAPPIFITLSREAAEVLENRIREARRPRLTPLPGGAA